MNIEFNNQKPLILDGGMGQTLIKYGMTPLGTLWSATALLDSSLHQMVIDAHQDFMRAGAKVITTNNFTVRKLRFFENNILDKFDEALHTAGLLATKAKQQDIVLKMFWSLDLFLHEIKHIWLNLNYLWKKFLMSSSVQVKFLEIMVIQQSHWVLIKVLIVKVLYLLQRNVDLKALLF